MKFIKKPLKTFQNLYCSDFETTTGSYSQVETKPYLLAISNLEVKSEEDINVFYNLKDYMKYIEENTQITFISFHNAKFDTQFILYYLLTNKYTFTVEDQNTPYTYTGLIDDMNIFYNLVINFPNGHKVYIEDSYKISNISLEQLSRTYSPDFPKLEADFELSSEEINNISQNQDMVKYVKRDVYILIKFYQIQLINNGLPKSTLASLSLYEYKEVLSTQDIKFRHVFPQLTKSEDNYARKAYSGGITQIKPGYENVEVNKLIKSYDFNSLYPSVLEKEYLPINKPKYFKGQPKLNFDYLFDDTIKPTYLHILQIHVDSFVLKENKLPLIKDTKSKFTLQAKYLTSGEETTLTLTEIDFYYIQDAYYLENIQYIDYQRYDCRNDLFKDFINKYKQMKINAKTPGEKQIAKDRQNSLYGKFGVNNKNVHKEPYLDENGIVAFRKVVLLDKKTEYLPISVFTTSYARHYLLKQLLKNYNNFLYCDTDSLYLIYDKTISLPIDSKKYGYLKHEHTFSKATFIKPKLYKAILHETDSDYNIRPDHLYFRSAGIQKSEKINTINYENLKPGSKFKQLVAKNIKGGCILVEREKVIE